MRHLDEPLARLPAHPLGRRLRRHQLRMLCLDLFQGIHQLVIRSIADLGIVEHIVTVLVVTNILPQRLGLVPDICFPRSHR